MTEKSDSGHSAPAEPAHPYMHPGPVGPQDDPQTVITPARPALFAAGRVELAGAGSTVWNRLFAPSSVEKTAADSEGIRLGYFVIEARIGVGGMGAVFRARDTRLQRTVALKV